MSYKNDWSGRQEELLDTVEEILEDIKKELDLNLSTVNLRKLFCESISSRYVQDALMEVMDLTHKNQVLTEREEAEEWN